MIDTTSAMGYASPMSVAPGQRIKFFLGSATVSQVDVKVSRVRCADPDLNGPGIKFIDVPSPIDGPATLQFQPVHNGSSAVVADSPVLARLDEFTLGCYIFPTLVEDRHQTIMSRWNGAAGWKLGLTPDGHLEFTVASGGQSTVVRSTKPLLKREWVLVGATVSLSKCEIGLYGLSQKFDGGRARDFVENAPLLAGATWPASTPLLFAAEGSGLAAPQKSTAHHFNGKIDRPRLHASVLSRAELHRLVEALTPDAGDPLLVGTWDFSRDIGGETIADLSANRHDGRVEQLPMRGVTGANWTGYSHSWTETPLQYGAIHFHEDDLADAGWKPTLELDIPAGWRSGYYTLRLLAGAGEDRLESYVTFFVRPSLDRPTAKVLIIASTGTYLAYANNRTKMDQVQFEAMNEGLLIVSGDDQFLSEHRELGMSTYDTHSDGSGSCYSSSLRPILNGRPRSNTFNYVNDTHLLDWLEQSGIDYDVVIDEDMHREGAKLLRPYQTVITLSHPEYSSKEMLDALESYQNGGGRHMYLGGNGFYWRIAFHPTRHGIIEMRRDIAGTRSWEGESGENSLSFTGEPSGLWRSCGRAPQRLVGVGFDAQVFDKSSFYRRLEGSFDPSAAFIMDGVGDDELIGDFGLRLGGAAGLEIDRADMSLGSPPNMIHLATADRMGTGGLPTPEEMPAMYRGMTGEENALVRADLVYFPTANGGAVFSTGSIAWVCALSHNGYDNNVSRITGNVLRRFIDPASLCSGEVG